MSSSPVAVKAASTGRSITILTLILITSLFLSMISSIAFAQATAPDKAVLGPVVRASAPGENINQVWAYADPTDGRYLIACGYFSYPQLNVNYGYVYSSSDAGASWRRTLLDDSTRWVTEESCTYGDNGAAYFAAGESDTSTGEPRHEWGHLQLYTSADHGMSWKRAGNRTHGWMDWTLLAALPKDQEHPESLAIFANAGTDRLGHSWEEGRPVALEASDAAQSFSALVAPPTPSDRNFGGGSVVLPDRTALFISGTTDKFKDANAAHAQVKSFVYSPSARTLQVHAVLRKMPPGRLPSLAPALARDAGSGRFHNRLYAAWSEFQAKGPAELWLASSDDNGVHWSSRAILSVADSRRAACPNDPIVFPDIRIAVNRDGVLGILWSGNVQDFQFAASIDGGRTFQSSTQVASHAVGEPVLDDAIPHNEWELAEYFAVRAGKSPVKFYDAHLGLSVRLSKPQALGDFALAADATGRFHAVWAGLDADGILALMSRTISTAAGVAASHALLANESATAACTAGSEPLHPQLPGAPPPLKLAGQQDLTRSFELHIVHIQYTPATHTVTAAVVLVNKGNKIVRGPFSMFAVGVHSDFGFPVALNANGVSQGQSFWDLTPAIPAQGLQPKASSQPLELRFKLEHFQAVPTGDAVAMLVRIYQSADQRSGG
jgi:hypothetical protein